MTLKSTFLMIKVEAYGEVDSDGKMRLWNSKHFSERVGARFKNMRIKITVEEDVPTKTNEQIKYYFGVFLKDFQAGMYKHGNIWDIARCRDLIESSFLLHEVVNTDTGEIEHRPKPLRDANKIEVGQMLTDAGNWAKDFGIDIRPPRKVEDNDIKWTEDGNE